MENEKWKMAFENALMENGKWKMNFGNTLMENEKWILKTINGFPKSIFLFQNPFLCFQNAY